MISQKNIPSLDNNASKCMEIVYKITDLLNSEGKKTDFMAIDLQLMHSIASDYLLMYKSMLYSKQFPHRKFIQENRVKH